MKPSAEGTGASTLDSPDGGGTFFADEDGGAPPAFVIVAPVAGGEGVPATGGYGATGTGGCDDESGPTGCPWPGAWLVRSSDGREGGGGGGSGGGRRCDGNPLIVGAESGEERGGPDGEAGDDSGPREGGPPEGVPGLEGRDGGNAGVDARGGGGVGGIEGVFDGGLRTPLAEGISPDPREAGARPSSWLTR